MLYEVYNAHKDADMDEPTQEMRTIQLAEAILESVPQSLLQSVFIIRTFIDNESDLQTTDILLLFLSIIASIISIATKYIIVDGTEIVNSNGGDVYATANSEKANVCSKKNACFLINEGYVIRSLWRIGSVTARVTIYSLVWSVMGGAFLIGYAFFELLLSLIFIGCFDSSFETKEQYLFMIVAMVSIYNDEYNGHARLFYYIRLLDDILILCVMNQ